MARTNALSISRSKSLSDQLFRCCDSCERDTFLPHAAARSAAAPNDMLLAGLMVLAWGTAPSPRSQCTAAPMGDVAGRHSVFAASLMAAATVGGVCCRFRDGDGLWRSFCFSCSCGGFAVE